MIRNKTNSYVKSPDGLIHFMPYMGDNIYMGYENSNVRCLNGSAHVKVSNDIKEVTCPKCLDKKTNIEYWSHWEKENGKIF